MKRDIVDVIKEEIVDRIDNTIRVKTITFNGDPTVNFIACDYKWLKPGRVLFDENNLQYSVVSIDPDTREIFTLGPGGPPLKKGDILRMTPPVFFSGTHMVANNEILKGVQYDIRQAVPIIWVEETVLGNRYPEDSSQAFDYDVKINFLDEIDVVNSLNAEIRVQGVKPMLALVDAFYEAVDDSYTITFTRSAPEKTMSRFGKEVKNGMAQNILDAHLGGVEIRPTLTISKSVECDC